MKSCNKYYEKVRIFVQNDKMMFLISNLNKAIRANLYITYMSQHLYLMKQCGPRASFVIHLSAISLPSLFIYNGFDCLIVSNTNKNATSLFLIQVDKINVCNDLSSLKSRITNRYILSMLFVSIK